MTIIRASALLVTISAAALLAGCSASSPAKSTPSVEALHIQGTIKAYNGMQMSNKLTAQENDSCEPTASALSEPVLVKDGSGSIIAKGKVDGSGYVVLEPQGSAGITTAVYCTVAFEAIDVPDAKIYVLSIGGTDTEPLTKAEVGVPLSYSFGSPLTG